MDARSCLSQIAALDNLPVPREALACLSIPLVLLCSALMISVVGVSLHNHGDNFGTIAFPLSRYLRPQRMPYTVKYPFDLKEKVPVYLYYCSLSFVTDSRFIFASSERVVAAPSGRTPARIK